MSAVQTCWCGSKNIRMIFTEPPLYKCVECDAVIGRDVGPDAVDHPPHYTSGGIETIDAIEAWGLNFHLGNAVKYISRAGKKDPAKTVEDLSKARWYLDREITRRTKGAT